MEQSHDIYLVATALEETWPKNKPFVFLGGWCLRFSRRQIWDSLHYTIAPYHWDERSLIDQDFQYLQVVYEKILTHLVNKMNELHRVNFSKRYWRILLGPWLLIFTQTFFDRWQIILNAAKVYPDAKLFTLSEHVDNEASADTKEFVEMVRTDEWNDRIFSLIAERWTTINVMPVEQSNFSEKDSISSVGIKLSAYKRIGQFFKVRIKMLINKVASFSIFRGRAIFLHSSYLKRSQLIKFALLFRQIFPILNVIPGKKYLVEHDMRKWDLAWPDDDKFASALSSLIPSFLPTCYVEGYRENSLAALDYAIPRMPSVMLTANAFAWDEDWKFSAAFNCENGTKLVISQHGGHYGVASRASFYLHEAAISDRYLTWGWVDPKQNKTYPAPAVKLIGSKRRKGEKKSGKCVLILVSQSRYFFRIDTGYFGANFEKYINEKFIFVKSLSEFVKNDLLVRNYHVDFGWDIETRWKEIEPTIRLSSTHDNYLETITSARLVVATYNSTTFLETLKSNIPTVIFWDPKVWELASEAESFYSELVKASILFYDPVECANHINAIWHDVPSWWKSKKVKNAVDSFTENYAYTGMAPLSELKKALTEWV